jgi:hypothetical protein
MGFFDEVRVPPPPPPPSYRLPDWLAPPENIAPGRLYSEARELWPDARDPPPTEDDVVI